MTIMAMDDNNNNLNELFLYIHLGTASRRRIAVTGVCLPKGDFYSAIFSTLLLETLIHLLVKLLGIYSLSEPTRALFAIFERQRVNGSGEILHDFHTSETTKQNIRGEH